MTPEETLIQRYFDAFNSHDIEGVMDCSCDSVIVNATGTRFEGREEVRRHYESGFALMRIAAAICAPSQGIHDAAWLSLFSAARGSGTGK